MSYQFNQTMVTVMNDEDNIDYQDMDELELPDHIEWNNEQPEEFYLDALVMTQW